MNPEDFEYLSTVLKDRSGLVLTKEKAYLLESRLIPVARKHGMKDLEEVVGSMRNGGGEDLLREVTEAMTTNESFFFRDTKPFEIFRETVLPQLLETRASKRSFRIWCAAASSGQEPYSLAMMLREEGVKLAGWKYEIIGTDLSTEILAKAKAGIYSQFEVQRGLPIQLLLKYFEKKEEMWQLNQDVRDMIQFKVLNLLGDLSSLGQFDVIFCRNVLIYFDQPTKSGVLEKLSKMIPNDGVLFLGGAETVLGITDKFKPVPNKRGIYCLTGA